MKTKPSISGKKIVEKSAMESSIAWVGGVFQWGLVVPAAIIPITKITTESSIKEKALFFEKFLIINFPNVPLIGKDC